MDALVGTDGLILIVNLMGKVHLGLKASKVELTAVLLLCVIAAVSSLGLRTRLRMSFGTSVILWRSSIGTLFTLTLQGAFL